MPEKFENKGNENQEGDKKLYPAERVCFICGEVFGLTDPLYEKEGLKTHGICSKPECQRKYQTGDFEDPNE